MIDVYIGDVEKFCDNREYPSCIADELEKISNDRVADEKRAVYGLLKYAMAESLGMVDCIKNISKTESGKPYCDNCFFSLSHAGGIVVAAVSMKNEVGVDVEPICDKNRDAIAKRNLSEAEQNEYFSLDEDRREKYFLKIWTQREAAYKLSDEKAPFVASKTADEGNIYKTVLIKGQKKRYVLTVACKNDEEIRFVGRDHEVNC